MSEEILDLPDVLERVQDDKELLLELFDIFTEDYKAKREGFNRAVESKNADEFRSIAHALKGASGNISAKQLRVIFMDCEEMGKSGDLTNASEKLKELDQAYSAFLAHLEEVKPTLQ